MISEKLKYTGDWIITLSPTWVTASMSILIATIRPGE